MRVGPKFDGMAERIGAALNLFPVPIGVSLYAMPIARSLQVAQRLGIFRELAQGPASAAELAQKLDLKEQGAKLLLDTLCVGGTLRIASNDRYELTPRSKKWLDPASDTYLGGFLTDHYHYWQWWDSLEGLVREGRSVEMHDRPDDDPYWSSYITGQYQLARLSSGDVAKAVDLDADAKSMLDVAGGHGEFSMGLCRRHPGLSATVVDLPGSARIGREIVAEAGMTDRVQFLEGDMFEADLGGPHDGALCFNIIHHLEPQPMRALFERVAGSLRPGAPLCVLDVFDRPAGSRPDTSSVLGLFFHLTSGADTYSADEVTDWIAVSGFEQPQRKSLRQLPGLALLRAERSG